MYEQRAEALQLTVGKPVSLLANGAPRAITREALSDSQILSLLREIAAPDAAGALDGGGALSFGYRAPSGEVRVDVRSGGEAVAVVRPTGAAATAAPGPDPAEARAAIEELFQLLVSSGASDLHLRSGEPPLLRLHGELARAERPVIPAERLEVMLQAIMTPKESGEYREGGDTDWAYEIEGLARFRCNAGRDRHGAMAVFRVIPTSVRTADEMGLSR